jgi:hypothetical protein
MNLQPHRLAILVAGVAALIPCLSALTAAEPVTRARTSIDIPEVPGYVMLKCDLHIHTVFSDGLVWPSVRAEEAWREGLDVIAITDHIEHQPHKADLTTNHNRSYEIARGAGNDLDVMVVKGSEITRKMPPGHLNAIFLTNSANLVIEEWHDVIKEAHRQGAFIFWNHPGWEAQLSNNVVRWYPEHTRMLEEGMLHGIEVVNGRDYYPEAHRWAIEKKLTMLSNSDIHRPLNLDYHVHAGDHRPLTLVFAKERSPQALKEALFARQTVVYSGNRLVGDEKFLRPIFENSVSLKQTKYSIKGKGRAYAQITNKSEVEYELEQTGELEAVTIPKLLVLPARKTVLIELRGKTAELQGARRLELPYKATNLLIGPDQPLPVKLELEINFSK